MRLIPRSEPQIFITKQDKKANKKENKKESKLKKENYEKLKK